MSRFDLFFVICDEADNTTDVNLARFIVDLHSKKISELPKQAYSYADIKRYITVAKKVKPRITLEAAQLLRKYYI